VAKAKTLVERSWCVVVPHNPGGARLARQRVVAELRDAVPAALLADVTAVLAELVGNAVRHADALPGDVIRVAWQLHPPGGAGSVGIRVTDGGGATAPRLRMVGPDSTDGRGLHIVAALAVRWGVDRDGLGQSVWAELTPAPADLAAPPADGPIV
jgi:anti-sigma regulatory factor (Ser/Thr protein kinase)